MEENKMIKQTKHGWVDLSNLPRQNGQHNRINWKASVGCYIPFSYKDILSSIYIDTFIEKQKICIKIPGYVENHIISTCDILEGKLGGALKQRVVDFRYQVGDIVKNNMLIISCFRNNGRKFYQYKCLNDGYCGSIMENDIIQGKGCPVCAKHKILSGYNDIATVRPDIAALFWNTEEACLYGVGSKQNVDFRCPYCGSKINAIVGNVCEQGLSCKKCSDGLSFPAKFIYSFLEQLCLHTSFQTEKTFEWSKNIRHKNPKLSGNKIYDFYIPLSSPIIIEVHGKQHYATCGFNRYNNSRTLQEEQENDMLKMNIALNNGIIRDNYIQLNCCESNMLYIKNSIMNSRLPQLLCFTEEQINWEMCNKYAISSRVVMACELWNDGVRSTNDIATRMKVSVGTALNYLHRGEELGLVILSFKQKRKYNKTK